MTARCTCYYAVLPGDSVPKLVLRDPLCATHYDPPRYVWPDGSEHNEPYTERVGKHGGCG